MSRQTSKERRTGIYKTGTQTGLVLDGETLEGLDWLITEFGKEIKADWNRSSIVRELVRRDVDRRRARIALEHEPDPVVIDPGLWQGPMWEEDLADRYQGG